MKFYDPKFVHFEWNDKLDGQYCFVADNIGHLIESVNENNTITYRKVSKGNKCYPFEYGEDRFRFAYYDPNYDVKCAYWEMGYDIYYRPRDKNCDWEKVSDNTNFLYVIDDPDYEFKIDDGFAELREAYKQGKTIQHMNLDGDWVDCDMPVSFVANHSYRVKPEEKKVKQDEIEELEYKLTVQTEFHKGNTIYYRNKTIDDSEWHPFSKATACKDYHFDFDTYEYKYGELEDTLYRPFKDTNELIAYWDKHYDNGNRPEYTMPLIWVKGKETGNVYLITGYEDNIYVCLSDDRWLSMKELFRQYKFLDGKCCGMVGK